MKNTPLILLLFLFALGQTSCFYFEGQGEWQIQQIEKDIMSSEYTLTILDEGAIINNSLFFPSTFLGLDRWNRNLIGGECLGTKWRYEEKNAKLYLYDLQNNNELFAIGSRIKNRRLKEQINVPFNFEIDPLEFRSDQGIVFSEILSHLRYFIFLHQNDKQSFSISSGHAEIVDIPKYVTDQRTMAMEQLSPYLVFYILADKKTPFSLVESTITSLKKENCKVALLGIANPDGKEVLHFIPFSKKKTLAEYLNELHSFFPN